MYGWLLRRMLRAWGGVPAAAIAVADTDAFALDDSVSAVSVSVAGGPLPWLVIAGRVY